MNRGKSNNFLRIKACIFDAYGTLFDFNSETNISIKKFQTTFEKLISDKNFKNKIIHRQNEFVENYLINHGNSSKKLLEYIQTI